MVKKIGFGLLLTGIMPIAFANSSQSISLSDPLQSSSEQSENVFSLASCNESKFFCPTQTYNFKLLDSDYWFGGITTSLLPNLLFMTCNEASADLNLAANGLSETLESSFPAVNSGVSLSSFSTTVSSQCGFAWKQQLHPTASLKKLKSTLTTKQNSISDSLVKSQFPKLDRSSLIVSFPQENSTFVPENNKLANPAPETERIASPFGWRKRPYSNQLQFHQGIDYGAPLGSNVVSVGNGIVTRVVKGCADFGNLFCGGQLGNWIEIDHGNGMIGTYGHLKYSSIAVEEGMRVGKNQPIAQVGSSGWSTGAHLDFRLKINGKHEDPAKYVMNITK